MSHASRTSSTSAGGQNDALAVGAFLRALAAQAESDATFATQIAAALRESGLMTASETPTAPRAKRTGARRAGLKEAPSETQAAPPDPFALLRERGESGLRAALDASDLNVLRAIVRANRLDPARISSRWTARERVISLIVDQVRARANHGKAFSKV